MSETRSRAPLSATICLLTCAICLPLSVPAHAQDDDVMRAMRDELARSMLQLQLGHLEKPYFLAYRVEERDAADVTASFGAVIASMFLHNRFLTVEVRVGSPKLDNTNFLSMSFLNQGGLAGGFGGIVQLPLGDNYKEIRRQIWLATDNAYKKAVENLSRKRAALQNQTISEEIPDFSQQKSATLMEALTPAKIEAASLEELARSLSGVYRGSAKVFTDSAHVTADQTFIRYVNSEGTAFTRVDPKAALVLMAGTQAPDGAPLRDYLAVYGRSLNELPALSELKNRALAMGERLEKLRAATVVDQYDGPVLFEGEAAGELFGEVMAPALLALRVPASDAPQFGAISAQLRNPLQDRIGGSVLPGFLSVADDPTLRDYQGTSLLGPLPIDDDGVPTRRTLLVQNGILKTLLTMRVPVRGITQSSGNRRGGTVCPTNLLVTVAGGLSEQEMKTKLQSLITQRGLPFGIMVTRLANPLIGDPQDVMASLMNSFMQGQGGGGPTQTALVAYKVYQDGREELIRNVTLEGLSTAAFRDIVAASASSTVYCTPFISMRNTFFALFGGGALAETSGPLVSLIVPSLLFDDVALNPSPQQYPKLPLSSRPVGD